MIQKITIQARLNSKEVFMVVRGGRFGDLGRGYVMLHSYA
jgi:predicted methyltransferase MtxX (methanogen marker protein 4)